MLQRLVLMALALAGWVPVLEVPVLQRLVLVLVLAIQVQEVPLVRRLVLAKRLDPQQVSLQQL